MTEPDQTPNSEFDTLNASDEREARTSDRRPRRRWLLPTAAIVLAALGAVALTAAALTAVSASANPEAAGAPTAPAATASAAPPRTPSPGSVTGNSSNTTDPPISQLADPTWITRIAAEGKIPERALAAYAGAALSVAQTNPGCGIGWNTLAAIGQVESEHGSINGSHLDDRGVAVPTIIGIPLDGNGTGKVPDTDHGQYDGDTTWDRAVGPMQFIPSTWALAGQDGNKDGAKDINQIDDAALAAAVHLCDVGGDLTQPENWIAAISAYNPSVEYNNRVAEAASHYATLR